MNVIWRELEGGCLLTPLPVGKVSARSLQMPMGKYRGLPIASIVEHDPKYIGWLVGQDWFFEKYPSESECLIECISVNPGVGGPSAA